jgi:HEAT repeat protein
MKFAPGVLSLPFRRAAARARYLTSGDYRKVADELARVRALKVNGNVVGLIHMLDSEVRGARDTSIVRDHAATALGRMGDPRAIPYLMELRDAPEEMTRFSVIQALGRLKAKEAERFLLERLDDPSPLIRMTAATALGHIGSVDAIPRLRESLDTDPDPYVRLHAVESLVILGDEAARDRVPTALNAVDPRTCEHPRYRALQKAARTGEALMPWVAPWESDPRVY